MDDKHDPDAADVVGRHCTQRPRAVVVPSASDVARITGTVDQHGHADVQEGARLSLRSKQGLLPLPCGACLTVDADGRLLGSRTAPRGTWFTYTRALEELLRSTVEGLALITEALIQIQHHPKLGSTTTAVSACAGRVSTLRRILTALADQRAETNADELCPEVRVQGTEGTREAAADAVGADSEGTDVGSGALPDSLEVKTCLHLRQETPVQLCGFIGDGPDERPECKGPTCPDYEQK